MDAYLYTQIALEWSFMKKKFLLILVLGFTLGCLASYYLFVLLQKDKFLPLYLQGEQLLTKKMYKEAIPYLYQSNFFNPNSYEIHLKLAETFGELQCRGLSIGHYEQAIKLIEESGEHKIDEALAYSRLGDTYFLGSEFTLAEKNYITSIVKEAKLPDPYMGLGFLYERLGMVEDSIKYFEKYLELEIRKSKETNIAMIKTKLKKLKQK